MASPPVEASAVALAEAVALELAPSAATAAAQRLHLRHAGFWGKVCVAVLAAMAAADIALAAPTSLCPHLIVTVCYTYMRNSCRYLVLHCCIVVSLLQYNRRTGWRPWQLVEAVPSTDGGSVRRPLWPVEAAR